VYFTRLWGGFWAWYERHYLLNVGLASLLFLLQLVHLYWLGAEPISLRLVDESFFSPSGLLQYLIFFIDYSEIPALVAVSLLYVNELRRGFTWRAVLFLAFLNSQWLHIFWITDEYVSNELAGDATNSTMPGWLAWVAILIDYLELPVIYDTLKRLAIAIRERRLGELAQQSGVPRAARERALAQEGGAAGGGLPESANHVQAA
jgi:hypothetical protein